MIKILTDSTCDIPDELIIKHNIMVIPQVIIWGNEQYRDRVDIQPEEFYRRLPLEVQRPTTSQASVADFRGAYERASRHGATSIITLTVSSAMSGTYQMALTAAQQVNVPVKVVDSKGPTMSLGWQVLAAARARDSGAEMDEILARIDRVRKGLVLFVAMETLEYLKKGGRIGGAIKWAGNLLQVRPLVAINHESGLVEPVSLARTHKQLVDMMYDKFFKRLKSSGNLRIAVLHGNASSEAVQLAERIEVEHHPIELFINLTGPVLGINTGPGALALCGYADDL